MIEPLYERSEGNAFLMEEIVAAMQAGAGPEELPVHCATSYWRVPSGCRSRRSGCCESPP
jgi:hypothetical protein